MCRFSNPCIVGALIGAFFSFHTPAPAAADRLHATLGQPLREVSHEVDVRLERDTVVYRVRRSFANNGERADEASLSIDLPKGAAVTGLRIRARDRWYEAELMEAEAAAARYRELTSMGAWEPKDPALLQWVWPDRVHLQVFPVLPDSASTVEYTLTAPLHYRDGRYVLSYPRFRSVEEASTGRLALAQPVLHIRPGHGGATTWVRVDGQRVPPDAPVVLAPAAKKPWIGEGEPEPGASHVFSALEMQETGAVGSARVRLDIDHTYRGDLAASLVTPSGEHLPIDLPDGSDNDVRGSFQVPLPAGTEAAGTWHLMVADRMGLDVGTLDFWSLELAAVDSRSESTTGEKSPKHRERMATGLPIFIPDAPQEDGEEGLALIEIEPPPVDTARARFGRVEVAKDLNFLRLEVEAAPELGTIPRQPSVVFVLDGSRSVWEIEPQLQIVRAYLVHVPDAQVEVVVFRRAAERVFGRFVPAAEFDEHLAAAMARKKLDLHNGSALELGLRTAADALRGRDGARRIVLTSDALVRTRFQKSEAIRALGRAPRGTIAHIALPEHSYELELERDDQHPLADIPASTEGVLFRARLQSDDPLKARAAAFLGLVRPVQIDSFAIEGVTLEGEDRAPEVLREGHGYRFMMRSNEAPRRVMVSGRVWNRRYRKVVNERMSFNRATAAFVFSEDEHEDLSREQMMKVAMFGRAVSPVTSYLAVEPGVRPSTAGIVRGEGGGTIGAGGYGTIGHGSGGGGAARKPFTIRELMAAGIARCVSAHRPAAGWRAELAVETTWREVVDVQLESGVDRAFDRCLVEAAWDVELTWNFDDRRRSYRVVLD